MATTATGTFTSCGAGQAAAVSYACTGPSCSNLNTFPSITCTNSGGKYTCSNGVTCSGTTNYTSSFNFVQNANKVQQNQTVVLDSGGVFTVTSDGTTGGTSFVTGSGGSSNTTKPSSSSSKPTSTPLYGTNTTTTTKPTSTSLPGTNTTTLNPTTASPTRPAYTGSAYSQRPSLTTLAFVFFFGFALLFGGADAYSTNEEKGAIKRDDQLPPSHAAVDIAARALVSSSLRERDAGFYTGFAKSYADYLGAKVTAANASGAGFATNLVAEVSDAVCSNFQRGTTSTPSVIGTLLEDCISIIYTGNALTADELEFLSIFGASLLCNYAVNEALPQMSQYTDALCNGAKPCGNLLTDPKNCGACGNVCPTGICANGACTSNSCTGQTCDTFGPCGPSLQTGATTNCVCASTTEGTGYCVDGETPCAGLTQCKDSTNCGSGEICASQSCCGYNVCVGATFCGGSTTTSKRWLFGRHPFELGNNATIGKTDGYFF